jgi:hypothetical protein
VEQNFPDAASAQLREDGVEAPSAVAEGVFVGAIAERNDAIADAGQVRAPRVQRLVEGLGVVRDIALPVRRGETNNPPRSNRGVR